MLSAARNYFDSVKLRTVCAVLRIKEYKEYEYIEPDGGIAVQPTRLQGILGTHGRGRRSLRKVRHPSVAGLFHVALVVNSARLFTHLHSAQSYSHLHSRTYFASHTPHSLALTHRLYFTRRHIG
jgi:hypothetical protein